MATKLELIFESENMFKAHRKQSAICLCGPGLGKDVCPASHLALCHYGFQR